ncbi:MAG: DUF3027 domain-containing protein [Nocardioidaceae bacterium]|nr:DUF3027 domain-containing protein [Nocardioidaceae bacterium]
MVTSVRRHRPDAGCIEAVDVARAALVDAVGAAAVGDHLGHEVEGERLVSHVFGCDRPGYRGWQWSVVVTRASRQRDVTVNEIALLPGDAALVSPVWVPYRERVRPGDVGPGDLLPTDDDDPRLVPGWLAGDERTEPLPDDDLAPVVVAAEIGLGRARVLSLEGRDLATARWYGGEHGPDAAVTQGAPASCASCGFLVRMAGPLSTVFGVCANEVAIDDGRVVSFDHGCGAHSEANPKGVPPSLALPEPVLDTVGFDDVESF